MSFGFSAGDFIAGANLAYRLIRALSETQGATMEYQGVIQELGCVQQTFLHVGQMGSCNLFSEATINAMSFIVDSSKEIMVRFLEKTEKYRRSLSGNSMRSSLATDSWRKIGWSLFKKQELIDLRETLQTRLAAINVLVSTATHHGQYNNSQNSSKFKANKVQVVEIDAPKSSSSTPPSPISILDQDGVNESEVKTEKKATEVHTQDSQEQAEEDKGRKDEPGIRSNDEEYAKLVEAGEVSRRKGIEKEAVDALAAYITGTQKPIKLTDPIGRVFSFPFHLCKTWPGMEEHLRQVFIISKTIGPQIAQSRFYILGPDGDIILPQFWDMLVEPDWNVTLDIWPISEPQERQYVELTSETLSKPISKSDTAIEAISEELPESFLEETIKTIPEEIFGETCIAVESNLETTADETQDKVGDEGTLTEISKEMSERAPDAVSELYSDMPPDKTSEATSESTSIQESISDVPGSELTNQQAIKTSKKSLSQYAPPKLAEFANWSKRKLKKHSHLVRGTRLDARTWVKIS